MQSANSLASTKGLAYRSEIDGMRGIAVLAIVLYHAGIGPAGGFVGVDVFFVISGYLITGLLLSERGNAGRADLLAFYARRIRRLFPALIVVVLLTLVAWVVLLPHFKEQMAVFDSAAAALVFASNFYFQSVTGGYFDADSNRMPLLHLWSLAVEEQFYIFWPLVLIGLLASPRRFGIALLIALLVGSLVMSEWWIQRDSSIAFYQMPARFWELAIGGLVALRPVRATPTWVAPAGVLSLLLALALPRLHFPGVGALPAVAGSALMLCSVHGEGKLGVAGACLRSRPMVFLGLISYSLYLWHWPLLALDKATRIGPSPAEVRVGLCLIAGCLATLSWRFVERPFRRTQATNRAIVAAGVAISLALASCSLTVEELLAQGEPADKVADTPASRAANDSDKNFIERCAYWPMESLDVFPKHGCDARPETRVILWGDSMAIAWEPMAIAMDPFSAIYARAGCPPAIGYSVEFRARVIRNLCLDFNPKVAATIQHVDTLILVARWEIYPEFDIALSKTLAELAPRARRVILLGVTPTMRDTAPRCIEAGKVADCAITRAQFDDVREPIRKRLLAIAANYPQVEYLDPTEFFCTDEICPVVKDGYSLYTDEDHVSATAARNFARRLAHAVK